MLKVKKRKKKNVTKDENHEHETFIQRTQSSHNRDTYDINNKFVKLISNDKIIKRKENFLFIKFLNEEFFNT